MRLSAAALRLVLLVLAAPASAQEMAPLAEWIKTPEAQQRPDYTYTRCAGLFLALAKLDGRSFLPKDLENMRDAYADFGNAAINFRAQRDGMAPKDFLDGVNSDIGDFVDAYQPRIDKARWANKAALDADPAMAQDFAVCRSVSQHCCRAAEPRLRMIQGVSTLPIRAVFAAAILLLAVPAAAQELQPLSEWAKGPDAKGKSDYLFTRCAALSLAVIKYDGMAYSQPELEHMKKSAVAYASAAAMLRSKRDGGKPEDYIAPIATDAEAMAEQYGTRIIAARQKPGRALDTDSDLAKDDEICRQAAGTPKK